MAKLSKKNLREEVYNKLNVLNKEQVLQVLDFVEFLKAKEAKETMGNPFLKFIMGEADPGVVLEQVREELSLIKGNLSDVIIKGREERM